MATEKPTTNAKSNAPSVTFKSVKPAATAKKSAPVGGVKSALKTPAVVAAPKSAPTPTALSPTTAALGDFDALLRDGQATVTTWLTTMCLLGQGAEAVSVGWSTFYCGSVETGFAVGKNLLRAKSLNEAIELQRDYTTRGLETLVTEATKLTEISVKAAGAASAPEVAHYDQSLTRWRQSIVARGRSASARSARTRPRRVDFIRNRAAGSFRPRQNPHMMTQCKMRGRSGLDAWAVSYDG